MSIEALYPSRRQPRAANPLFARQIRRRRRVALAAAISMIGGFAALQLLPAPEGAVVEGRSAAVPAPAASAAPAPVQAQKPVRVIPL